MKIIIITPLLFLIALIQSAGQVKFQDNFERALQSADDNSDTEGAVGFREGVELIYQKLTGVLKDWGVEPMDAMGAEFGAVLAPVWRIVVASILAEVVAELIDTEIYHWFVTRVTTRFQWLRVLTSNSVAVPCDSLLFTVGAFAFALPWAVVIEIFLFNLLVKYAVTLVSLPLIYVVPEGKRK